MNDKILITGGLGYVGGRVVQRLAEKTDRFLLLGTRKSNVPKPEWLKVGAVVQMDLMSDDSLDAVCKGIGSIIHLAAFNEIDSLSNPEQALLINSLGTLKLLRAAERAGVKRFIYFSTAHVYGAPLVGQITEETLPRPIHPYAITHHAAEDFVLAAHDEKKITGIVVRLSNGFGAPTHPDVDCWTLLVNDLCRQAVQTRKLSLRSSGLQQRDFITLTDVGRAVTHLLSLPEGRCGNGLFNLGGETVLSVWEMAQNIARRCQTTLGFLPCIERPEPKPDEQAAPLHYDCDKIQKTGFILKGDVDDEIDRTLMVCKQAWSGGEA